MKRWCAGIIVCAMLLCCCVGCSRPPVSTPTTDTDTPTGTAALTLDGDSLTGMAQLQWTPPHDATRLVLRIPHVADAATQVEVHCADGDIQTSMQADDLILTRPDSAPFGHQKIDITVQYALSLPHLACANGLYRTTYHLVDYIPLWQWDGHPVPCDMDIALDAPSTLVVLPGAQRPTAQYADDRQVLHYTLSHNSHPVLVASGNYKHISQPIDDTTTLHYYYHGDSRPDSTLSTAARIARYYTRTFGALPYTQIAIASSGIEGNSTDLTLLQGTTTADIASALGGLWFDGLLRTDRHAAPWIFASLTAFGTWLQYTDGQDVVNADKMLSRAHLVVDAYDAPYFRMDGTIDSYTDTDRALLAHKGLLMWHTLYIMLGAKLTDALAVAMRQAPYCCTTEGYIDTLCAALDRDYHYYFEAWLQGTVLVL